ncbi:hypothetical protein DPMN_070109 [Dreissena polymorpha]|uniref:Uncharacterized protein n=1 Tax=Dreissena polymorpha TaxID=45954 RepID=A0A9D3Z4S9_DREPO|nr:hypothetical protein DPMN_070109 [Dreissena polymorpha]
MLELRQQREINQWKYRLRTASFKSNHPINESVTLAQAYFKRKHGKRFGLPYAQKVFELGSYYNTLYIKTQSPTYLSPSTLSRPDIDLQLTPLVKISDNDKESGSSIAQTHITNNYSKYIQIYTDGSKNDEQQEAGAAYVTQDNLHSQRDALSIYVEFASLMSVNVY